MAAKFLSNQAYRVLLGIGAREELVSARRQGTRQSQKASEHASCITCSYLRVGPRWMQNGGTKVLRVALATKDLLPFEGKRAIPFGVRNERRPFLPISSSYAIQVPDNQAVSHCELTYQLLATFEPAAQTVHKAEFPFLS